MALQALFTRGSLHYAAAVDGADTDGRQSAVDDGDNTRTTANRGPNLVCKWALTEVGSCRRKKNAMDSLVAGLAAPV
jgi:hypothetical protein